MKYLKLLSIALPLLASCSKENEEAGINSKPKADFLFSDEIDHFTLNSTSTSPNSDILTYKWISLCDTVKVATPHLNSTYFNLPNLSTSEQLKIKLVVSNGTSSDSIIKSITLPSKSTVRTYGLGCILKKELSNNASYAWYYDQGNTGPYSDVNCGPSSVTMAIKWANASFSKTPEEARKTYRPTGGWWYTNDIVNYLNLHSIPNHTIDVSHIDLIQSELNLGNIAILCLDMYYIRSQSQDKWHVDKFYSTNNTGWGHFIVIKGYKNVDNKVYYEVYDPYSFGKKYSDGSIKGEDRYYRSEDLNNAVANWWKYAIIVSKNKSKSSSVDVDIRKIQHKPGR